jgi:catechol 2,3-dioxygenase-like lactoylglutathione lyase family enzyme
VFESLDFLYVPTADIDAAVRHYVDVLGGELVWRVRGMGTTVANVRLSTDGPAVLLSGHLDRPAPVLVYRVADYDAAIAALRAAGQDDITELEIPHGPCASFPAPDGQRVAVYELRRPEAAHYFDGRTDS